MKTKDASVCVKVGDKIRCIETPTSGFFGKIGEIYTVAQILMTSSPSIQISENFSNPQQWNSLSRFEVIREKIEPASKEKQKAIEQLKILEEKVDKLRNIVDNMI